MSNFSLNLLVPALVAAGCGFYALFHLLVRLRLNLQDSHNFIRNANVYLFRKRFAISVNCHFCNCNSRVPYDQRNSFECKFCKQYNGFAEDGDYNKEIPEQHSSRFANYQFCQKTESRLPPSNGLCAACNRNQEMKVVQLANFKPRNDFHYDEEIEEYRQKLEDSYQLCPQCQRALSKTLNRIKTKFIGSKITQLMSKGIKAASASQAAKEGRHYLSWLAMFLIVLMSIVNFCEETYIDLGGFLRSVSSSSLINIYHHLMAIVLTFGDLFKSLLSSMDMTHLLEVNTDSIAISAVILNFGILYGHEKLRKSTIASLLLWSLKMVLSEVNISSSYNLAVKGTVAAVLIYTSLLTIVSFKKKNVSSVDKNSSFHKIISDQIDDSENEDYNDTCSSSDRQSLTSSPSTIIISRVQNRTLLGPASTYPALSKSRLTMQNNSFGGRDTILRPMDTFSNDSFSIRQEVATADRNQVQSEINKLNISGSCLGSTSTLKDFSINKSLNPFSLANSRCGSPTSSITSVFSGAHRSPPQLTQAFVAEPNTSSWVAGGYWCSPQKRFLEAQHFNRHEGMSRSSSQSSGLGTIDSDKNSRENSIIREDFAASLYSEPVRKRNMFNKSLGARSLFSQSSVQPPTVNSFFNPANSFRTYRDSSTSFFK